MCYLIYLLKYTSLSSLIVIIILWLPSNVIATHNTVTAEELEQRLITNGWKRETASRVIELNLAYFSMLDEEDPGKLDLSIYFLERLGKYAGLMSKINDFPELAGLLANADNPWDIANSFPESDCYGAVAGLYQLLITPKEQQDLADALNRHGKIICQLANYGIPMPAAIFMFDHNQPGAKEYAAWLEQVIKHALTSSSPMTPISYDQSDIDQTDELTNTKEQTMIENLAVIVSIIIDQGPYYRERMKTDLQFRNKFRQTLWPAFIRLTDCSKKPEGECDTPIEMMIQEPRIWDLLLLEDGEVLFDRWGLLTVELLVDDPDPNGNSFPADLRPVAREAMHSSDNNTLSILHRTIIRDEPLFRQLMLRDDLDPELRERVLADLDKTCTVEVQQCPGLVVRLRQLLGYSPTTLREELGPPPSGVQTWLPLYSTYYLGKKIITGRPVDTMDIVLASTDVFFLATMTMGPVKPFIKPAANSVTKEVAKQTTKNAAKLLVEEKLKKAFVTSLEKIALKGQLAVAIAKRHIKTIIKQTRILTDRIGKLLDINVTPMVQWIFEKTGIGRETMKKLTGLEARVFMRQDRRVVVNPKNSKVLREFAENALGNTISGTETAKEAAQYVYSKGLAAKGSLEAWRQHASSWWLANATGSL